MVIRSKAPLRLSLAGGGSDVSPFSDLYGGAILNITLNLYAYASIEPTTDGLVTLVQPDKGLSVSFEAGEKANIQEGWELQTGIYNRMLDDFIREPLSFRLTTMLDAPVGSGLGTSSTLAVAILGAFTEWLHLPLGEYDIAHLAYAIERIDLGMAGGKQDQYSATFGGVNFMEFSGKDHVVVNPLRIKDDYLNELTNNLLLYYTGTTRQSANIISVQQQNVKEGNIKSVEAMHQMKTQAIMMKEALLKGNLDKIGEILNYGWHYKKQMAEEITNPLIEEIYDTAMNNGATGGKISGAGGGGFMAFYCPGNSRFTVQNALLRFGGFVQPYEFTSCGLRTWTI
ncbi:MAG: dehydrogenase [Bacteroidales bacterium]|nr:dehydrogenase [Bacteroidales bacterium]